MRIPFSAVSARFNLPSLLVWLALPIGAGADTPTVGWHSGTAAPPNAIIPEAPTDRDELSFTVDPCAGLFPFCGGPFSNSCEAVNHLGSPSISADLEAREFTVRFSETPFPPYFCPTIYAPVNGIEGKLGRLEAGDWTLKVVKTDFPVIDIELPFRVAPATRTSGELVIHSLASQPIFPTLPTLPTRLTVYTPPTFTTPIFSPRFFARPLGRRCNPQNGGGLCGNATLQQGAPLKGTPHVKPTTATPVAQFSLPRSALGASATGSLPPLYPYLFVTTFASGARNETGLFAAGGGPGSYTFGSFATLSKPGRVRIRAGANQFGGTMRLLGALASIRAHEYQQLKYLGTLHASFRALGGRCAALACPVPAGSQLTTSLVYQTSMGRQTNAAITEWGFPWTTGRVSVAAGDGYLPSTLVRSGFDNRTPGGLGSIQLVAPQLVRWSFPHRGSPWDRHSAAIGVLHLKFVPEPAGWLALGAGLVALTTLRRSQAKL